MGAFVEFLVVLGLILTNGLLSMSEMAIVAARQARLRQLEENGNTGASTAIELAADPGAFLSTVQIGITLIGILIGAFGGAALGQAIAYLVGAVAPLEPYASAISVVVVVLLLTYLTLLLGELVPKQLALANPAQIAARVAPPLNTLSRLASPLVAILNGSSSVVLRILRHGPSDEPAVTEEDVRIMVKQGAELGVFEPMEEKIVGQLFRLGDQEIGALMTPRNEVMWIAEGDPMDTVREKVIRSGRSRLPVARGDLDDVVGIILAKNLLERVEPEDEFHLHEVMQPPLFVPENAPALEVIQQFKDTHSKIAMVIDEYGGVEGLVTVDDIMGALIGDIPEWEGSDEPTVIRRADGSWLVDGLLPLDEMGETLGITELPARAEQYRTAGGMMMALVGRLPAPGDRVEWNNLWFEVVDMDGLRVDKILVSRADMSPPEVA